jgi:phosphotransferase system enzyme I (PtsI)
MMQIKGLAVSPGIVIGKAKIIKQRRLEIKKRVIAESEIMGEISKFDKAIDGILLETDKFIEYYTTNKDDKEIFESHQMILQDPELKTEVIKLIKEDLICLEQAIHQHFNKVAVYFDSLDNDFFAQKATDYIDVSHRILNFLIGKKGFKQTKLDEGDIPIFYSTTPTQVVQISKEGVKGFYVEKGSETSHNSIIARSFGLACVVGVPNIFNEVKDGDTIILDGIVGEIWINPTDEVLADYKIKIAQAELEKKHLQEIVSKDIPLIDGKKLSLKINVEIPEEVDFIQNLNADGIGLFRTEFLYMDRDSLPTEDEQFEIYKQMVTKMEGKPMTIRTFDLGGDKFANIFTMAKEANPFLGNRGLRFSLSRPNIFRTQINAILRASAFGKIKIMFPMVIGTSDFLKAKRFVKKAISNLLNKGYDLDENIEIGVMVEIPSAAICSKELAKHVDFFSIGTNDLIQYTLSVDRTNDLLNSYYIPHHPAVLSLIKLTAESAKQNNIPVSVCGAMASNNKYIPLLLALGIDKLSISPSAFLSIKHEIINLDTTKMTKFKRISNNMTLPEIEELLGEE